VSRNVTARLREALRRPTASAERRRFFNAARPLTRYLSVEAKGLTFLVTTDDRLGRGLFVRGWRQDFRHLDRAMRLLEKYRPIGPEAVFVDVGANIGTTTVRAIRRHGFARGVALEPAPQNFRTLRLNLVANDIDSRVTAVPAAVSDHDGRVELALSSRTSGEHTIVPPNGAAPETLTVEALSLDGLIERGVLDPDAVGLLWIDAQGAEGLALAGATALLERGVPIALAVRPKLANWRESRNALVRLLADYTDFADLRRGKRPPTGDLASLLDSATDGGGDLLAVRRPARPAP
jgi:FkbM family methyltransferase